MRTILRGSKQSFHAFPFRKTCKLSCHQFSSIKCSRLNQQTLFLNKKYVIIATLIAKKTFICLVQVMLLLSRSCSVATISVLQAGFLTGRRTTRSFTWALELATETNLECPASNIQQEFVEFCDATLEQQPQQDTDIRKRYIRNAQTLTETEHFFMMENACGEKY